MENQNQNQNQVSEQHSVPETDLSMVVWKNQDNQLYHMIGVKSAYLEKDNEPVSIIILSELPENGNFILVGSDLFKESYLPASPMEIVDILSKPKSEPNPTPDPETQVDPETVE